MVQLDAEVKDVGAATDLAMQQARRAGLPMLFVTVTGVTRTGSGNWEVVIGTLSFKYKAVIDSKTGNVVEWLRI